MAKILIIHSDNDEVLTDIQDYCEKLNDTPDVILHELPNKELKKNGDVKSQWWAPPKYDEEPKKEDEKKEDEKEDEKKEDEKKEDEKKEDEKEDENEKEEEIQSVIIKRFNEDKPIDVDGTSCDKKDCILYASDVKINDGQQTVTFHFGKTKYIIPIEKIIDEDNRKKPVIKMDIIVNDVEYKGVLFVVEPINDSIKKSVCLTKDCLKNKEDDKKEESKEEPAEDEEE